MYCPVCKDEFRAGFTRCAACDVDLVDRTPGEGAAARPADPAKPASAFVRLTDYCGFTGIAEARDGRDRLRDAGVRTEIAIREAPESRPDGPIVEEYWLRVETDRYAYAVQVLGFDAVSADGPEELDEHTEEFDCGACGQTVNEHETFCPKCGARFDDD